MSTYQPDRLLQLWKLEEIDNQMVIGHMIQNLVVQAEALAKLTVAFTRLQGDMDKLIQQMQAYSSGKGHK
jgi:hypothetical protein